MFRACYLHYVVDDGDGFVWVVMDILFQSIQWQVFEEEEAPEQRMNRFDEKGALFGDKNKK